MLTSTRLPLQRGGHSCSSALLTRVIIHRRFAFVNTLCPIFQIFFRLRFPVLAGSVCLCRLLFGPATKVSIYQLTSSCQGFLTFLQNLFLLGLTFVFASARRWLFGLATNVIMTPPASRVKRLRTICKDSFLRLVHASFAQGLQRLIPLADYARQACYDDGVFSSVVGTRSKRLRDAGDAPLCRGRFPQA